MEDLVVTNFQAVFRCDTVASTYTPSAGECVSHYLSIIILDPMPAESGGAHT